MKHSSELKSWQEGDLVLMQPRKLDSISRLIIDWQHDRGYATHYAQWTHAAIYLGRFGNDALLCEADFARDTNYGVCIARLDKYAMDHRMFVRRSRIAAADPFVGARIAIAAALRIGTKYDWPRALNHFLAWRSSKRRFLRGKHLGAVVRYVIPERRPRLVCSTLFAAAHAEATAQQIELKFDGFCSPAHLAAALELQDVIHAL